MGKKRVFILGAGFSKQAGMPLATELTSLVLDGTELGELEDLQGWLDDFKQRLAAVVGVSGNADGFKPNVEQLFDFAAYDEELWRMKQQLCPVPRAHGDTPWNRAESIRTWLGYMEQQLPHVIWDVQQEADPNPVRRFTTCLRRGDVVITFNYDTLVESALSSENHPWNHGLNDKGNGGVTVLKMHGSVDWLLLPRRSEQQLAKFVKLFSKPDVDVEEHGAGTPEDELECVLELWRAKDNKACNVVMEEHRTWGNSELGLAGLGRHKPLHTLPGSAPTWSAAFEALKNADKVYVVGFSMSPYDSMTRFHFTAVMRLRSQPPDQVVVVDPNADKLKDVLSVVFGRPPELIALAAENVDWQDLLR